VASKRPGPGRPSCDHGRAERERSAHPAGHRGTSVCTKSLKVEIEGVAEGKDLWWRRLRGKTSPGTPRVGSRREATGLVKSGRGPLSNGRRPPPHPPPTPPPELWRHRALSPTMAEIEIVHFRTHRGQVDNRRELSRRRKRLRWKVSSPGPAWTWNGYSSAEMDHRERGSITARFRPKEERRRSGLESWDKSCPSLFGASRD